MKPWMYVLLAAIAIAGALLNQRRAKMKKIQRAADYIHRRHFLAERTLMGYLKSDWQNPADKATWSIMGGKRLYLTRGPGASAVILEGNDGVLRAVSFTNNILSDKIRSASGWRNARDILTEWASDPDSQIVVQEAELWQWLHGWNGF